MSYTNEDGHVYRIADTHTHIYKPKIAAKASAAIGEFYDTPMSVSEAVGEMLVQRGSSIGCERYVVCSAATTVDQVSTINQFIADECAQHPEFVGLGTAHPLVKDMDALVEEIVELGLQGIKLHPDFQKFSIDDDRMIPLYKAAAKHGLVMLFHVGDERYDFSSPVNLARALDAVPDMKCHAAHFGCCRTWNRPPVELAGTAVMFDTSSMLAWAPQEVVLGLIDLLGWEKLMWGTDFPMWDHKRELDRFFALGLSPEQNEAILYNNFANFYQVS